MSDIHDGVKYRDVKYKMRRSNGEEYEEEGAWLLVDGGNHKRRCLQCPLKHSALPKEKLWREWAETVRKDVECVFGVLKGRFRCLKLSIYYHDKDNIDNMFYCCCILHSILFHFDGLDVRWEEGVNYIGMDGNHADEDMYIFRHHLSRVRFLTPLTDYTLRGVVAVEDRFRIVHGSSDTEFESSYRVLQKQLVDHYVWKYQNNQIQWLKKEKIVY